MGFICFMASTAGRVLRVVLGAVLLTVGLTRHTPVGYVLAVVSLVPLAAGLFDVCVVAKLMGHPFSGKEIRAHCAAQGR